MGSELVPSDPNEFLIYQTEDGRTRVQVRIERETVWLSQRDMGVLFQTTPQNITTHIRTLYEEGELIESATCKDYLQVRIEGEREVRRQVKHYNLDVIISVGYRVKSLRGTQFRIWATERLREYLVKGFTMDDDRLKRAGAGDYFEELLARIRDIRSSERVFWRKVLDIYATSIDYDPSVEASQLFFKTVQNKMHWAAHGHTAAEVIHGRADATQPQMGLTAWAGDRPRKADVGIAKNYLNQEEIETLNLLVSAYLDFAELQARSRRPMTMADWIGKLDDFLRLSDRDILTHAGRISHEEALGKAEIELEKYRQAQATLPQPVDQHFEQTLDELKQVEARKSAKPKKKAKKKPPKPPQSGEGE